MSRIQREKGVLLGVRERERGRYMPHFCIGANTSIDLGETFRRKEELIL